MAIGRLGQAKHAVNRRIAGPFDCIFCLGSLADLVGQLRQSKEPTRFCVKQFNTLFQEPERVARPTLSELAQSEMLKQCRRGSTPACATLKSRGQTGLVR
jgi:hypothetical protein